MVYYDSERESVDSMIESAERRGFLVQEIRRQVEAGAHARCVYSSYTDPGADWSGLQIFEIETKEWRTVFHIPGY